MKNNFALGISPLKWILVLVVITGSSFSAMADVVYSTPLNGYEQQIGNMLEWGTAQENNSQMFIVEKSIDGVEFENIGVVNASGDSDREKGYRFLDINSTKEKAFYRLRQMDTDGTGSFSQTIMIKRNFANQFMVVAMSNTTTNKNFDITLDAVIDGVLNYQVLNIHDDMIQEGQIPLSFGLNDLSINLADEKEGSYRINLVLEDELESLLIRKSDDIDIEIKENVASKRSSNGG